MLRSRDIVRIALAPAAAVIFGASACGNGAIDVNGCREIEEARCRQAPACGVSLEPPYYTSGSGVDACIRYYEVACLHGLGVPDPGTAALDACAKAISTGDCALVQSPETGPCAWLAPSASSSSAAEPIDAAEEPEEGEAGEPTDGADAAADSDPGDNVVESADAGAE